MKTEADKATPRPWSISKYSKWDKTIFIPEAGVGIDNDDVDPKESAANAALIVCAVNLYEAHTTLEELVRRAILIAHNQRQLNSRIGMPIDETQWEINAKQALVALDAVRKEVA